MRILVVDDDRAVRQSLRRSLIFNGYDVNVAADGVEALERIERQRPDLVLLDVMMPRMGGLETCQRMREQGCTTPVLLLTAHDGVTARDDGLAAGADDYLPKPFALDELLGRIRTLLGRTPAAV
jgi:two-component system, OmpR family, response regulator MprA